ncbi:Glyoxylase, beta-lactamase superfamily II [Propionibacterium cyclohexanicum]|uniref:Glyoxylase, beta-lactamase superfamily II n=1 Tax=Propionibacterium cyclohexanicum TaxID=64702 RepID=A0A1H9Q2V4_9ACTN|nr:MBL fold metallo-hydrolase [Propionibacterium cyclohexanicum]SER54760.1 Glyoxylase, beta-lactamase superfamily II [Propionibacterium cyclohexanicum]
MFIAYFVAGPWQANCYVVSKGEGQEAIAIDVGMDAAQRVDTTLAEHHLELSAVLLTHGHIDHCAQAGLLADAHGCPVWVHEADRGLLSDPGKGLSAPMAASLDRLIGTRTLSEPAHVECYEPGVGLAVAGLDISVIHAPGHTPGSVLLGLDSQRGRLLFTGDVLFAGSIGRTDLPGGDDAAMRASLREKIRTAPGQAHVLPGHGPSTTVKHELENNPYLTDSYLEVQY